MSPSTPFRILTVCTGNICRSPMAERLLQSGFDSLRPGVFQVASAGTSALVGSRMDPRVAGFVHVFGGSTDGFAARQLTAGILDGPDLVLALTREHRGDIVELCPSLLRRTFTLRELARLLPLLDGDADALPSDRWRNVLPKALRARTANPVEPKQDDIVDPFRRPEEVYHQMVRELTPAVDALLAWERKHG